MTERKFLNLLAAAGATTLIGIYSFFDDNDHRHSFVVGTEVTSLYPTSCNTEPMKILMNQQPPTRMANMNQFHSNSVFTIISQPPGSEVLVRTSTNLICYTNRFGLEKLNK